MADIDLKTETPDTTLPTTGFLFGADSQAAASPSVYSTQTVATTLLGSTTLTGATVTTSQPVIDASQTWNDGAVTFTGLKFNATDTASASGSLLMDLQVGGTSRFDVDKNGFLYNTAVRASGSFSSNNFYLSIFQASGGGVPMSALAANGVTLHPNNRVSWSAINATQAPDLLLTRRAAANLRLGAADAAGSAIAISSVASQQITLASNHGLSNGAAVQVTFTAGGAVPGGTAINTTYYARSISAAVLELYGTYDQALNTASTTGRVNVTSAGTTAFINRAAPFQTLSVQSFTGTDIPGQPFVITGSQGTGTGAGGSIIFQVAPAGSSGTAQNALATAWTIRPDKSWLAGGYTSPSIQIAWLDGYGLGSNNNAETTFIVNNQHRATIGSGVTLWSGSEFGFSSGAASAARDTILARDAANTLALRNGANAQTFRVYNTFTSATDFERANIFWDSNVLKIGTEKGSAGGTARALEFQTDGVTRINISAANRIAFFNSTASGSNSVCLGVSGTASGQDSSVLGAQNTASASQALVASYASSASATWASVFGGVANYATSTGSCIIGGYSGKTISRGQLTTGFKTFANDGDAQYSQFGFRGTTSDATQTEIFLWGDASNRATIPANTTWLFTVFVTAITQNGASNSGFVRRGMIKRDGSNNTSIVGTVQTIGTDIGSNSGSPPAGWDVSLTADDTNEALALKVTGAAATNIRWVARIEALEVQFA